MRSVLRLMLLMALATLAPLTVAAQQNRWGAESEPTRARAEANPSANQHWGQARPKTVAQSRPHRYHHLPRHHYHRDHDRFRHDRDHDHDRH